MMARPVRRPNRQSRDTLDFALRLAGAAYNIAAWSGYRFDSGPLDQAHDRRDAPRAAAARGRQKILIWMSLEVWIDSGKVMQ